MAVAPPSPPYLGPAPHAGSANNKPIRRVVIHCTAGAEPGLAGAARGTIEYTKSHRDVVSSYHYVADAKGSYQFVYDSVVAYHCGTNSNSIGYELSCSLSDEGKGHWARDDHQAMLRIAAADVARLCLAYDVPIAKLTVADLKAGGRGICGHVDMRDAFGNTTHWDPGPFFPWTDFIRMVHDEADRLTSPQPVKPKPPAPPVPATPPHDPFAVGMLPGRWNAPLKDEQGRGWLTRWREARDNGCGIVTLTEGTNPNTVAGLQTYVGHLGWPSYHDPAPGPANIIHTWDSDRFEMVGLPWKVKLTDIPVVTPKGFEQPDPHSVGIALRDKKTNRVALVVGAHLPLENTARRRKAKEEAITVLQAKAFEEGRAQFPKATRILNVDWNRRAHKQSVRDWFTATWPGLTAGWAPQRARTQGPDWTAVGVALVVLEARVLPRAKGDPLDHTTKITRVAWR